MLSVTKPTATATDPAPANSPPMHSWLDSQKPKSENQQKKMLTKKIPHTGDKASLDRCR